MTTWMVILATAAGTYAMRAAMLVALAGRELSPRSREVLALVGPAALAALVASSLLGGADRAPLRPEVVAAVAAFIVVRHTGRVTDALVVGLPVMWGLAALGAA